MRSPVHVAFLVQKLGPYHHARLQAWASMRTGILSVIEFRPGDRVYAWDPIQKGGAYRRYVTETLEDIVGTLDRLHPEVLVCTGYADREIHAAVNWALSYGVRLVTCSDSTFDDEPRSWIKEGLKRTLIAAFDTALVAGQRSADYLHGLGIDPERRFKPWDVVDNAHFEKGADKVRKDPAGSRARWSLPDTYFLCVARFVPKKNLGCLIDAYAHYVAQVGEASWSLVISGSGPLSDALKQQVAKLGLDGKVRFPGFLQYPELPACYGLAGALVLPSVSDQWGLVVNEAMAAGIPVIVSRECGCAADLVIENDNGYVFDAEDKQALAAHFVRITELDVNLRAMMGRRSRELISSYSPQAFARGAEEAVTAALERCHHSPSWLTRTVVNLLARRPLTSRLPWRHPRQ